MAEVHIKCNFSLNVGRIGIKKRPDFDSAAKHDEFLLFLWSNLMITQIGQNNESAVEQTVRDLKNEGADGAERAVV